MAGDSGWFERWRCSPAEPGMAYRKARRWAGLGRSVALRLGGVGHRRVICLMSA